MYTLCFYFLFKFLLVVGVSTVVRYHALSRIITYFTSRCARFVSVTNGCEIVTDNELP